MNDVIGQVVLTTGNKDFGAGNFIGTVRLRCRLGTQHAQVRSTVRFGQTHGAAPLTTNHLRQVALFLEFGTHGFDQTSSRARQTGVHTPGPVGRAHQLINQQTDRRRQILSTDCFAGGHRRPTAFHIGVVGFFKSCRRGHTIFRPSTTFLITG